MPTQYSNTIEYRFNPINIFEKISISNNWAFERPLDEEIYVEVPTKYSNLIIQISWSKKDQTIDLKASFYIKMDFSTNDEIFRLLNLINNTINIGHFQINESKYPTFRYSMIFNDIQNLKFDILNRTLNYAISESEKFFPAFQLILWAGKKAEEAIMFLDFATEGKA